MESLSLWDPTALTRVVGNNPAIHQRLLQKYLSTARTTMEGITSCGAKGDWLLVAEHAHKLKSASRSVGAMQLGALCEALERAGRAGHGVACSELLQPVSQGYERVEALIHAHLQPAP